MWRYDDHAQGQTAVAYPQTVYVNSPATGGAIQVGGARQWGGEMQPPYHLGQGQQQIVYVTAAPGMGSNQTMIAFPYHNGGAAGSLVGTAFRNGASQGYATPNGLDDLSEHMGGMRLAGGGMERAEYSKQGPRVPMGYAQPPQQTARFNNNHKGNGRGGGNGNRRGNQQNGGRSQALRGPHMEDKISRTVYINSVDPKVTEAQLASFFASCGRIQDCRICGDPNAAVRFAFIEFIDHHGAAQALDMSGSELAGLQLRVLPSKTAIMPVNNDLMPRSQDDVERCGRTVYVANIDKRVDKLDVRRFFDELCGKVSNLRLLGDNAHATRIAFVEFAFDQGAQAALNCSGAVLGSLPIRVSPSKTPLRPEANGNATTLDVLVSRRNGHAQKSADITTVNGHDGQHYSGPLSGDSQDDGNAGKPAGMDPASVLHCTVQDVTEAAAAAAQDENVSAGSSIAVPPTIAGAEEAEASSEN